MQIFPCCHNWFVISQTLSSFRFGSLVVYIRFAAPNRLFFTDLQTLGLHSFFTIQDSAICTQGARVEVFLFMICQEASSKCWTLFLLQADAQRAVSYKLLHLSLSVCVCVRVFQTFSKALLFLPFPFLGFTYFHIFKTYDIFMFSVFLFSIVCV